ncbi:hypothetical protein HDU87_001890 [Geranomyces variabilis]|uniref:Uncharacterized protein n=1 Tax=Geranomyces variabilis TaxID=109894 RepID=A0AAD5XL60_9FUNG|nr:hypothetical protein HDU87_001890 [Geranomyces variabilis]
MVDNALTEEDQATIQIWEERAHHKTTWNDEETRLLTALHHKNHETAVTTKSKQQVSRKIGKMKAAGKL